LGMMGYAMFILNKTGVFDGISGSFQQQGQYFSEVFESIHIMIFICLVLYIILAILLVLWLIWVYRLWHRFEKLDYYAVVKESHIIEAETFRRCSPLAWWEWRGQRRPLAYLRLRMEFVSHYKTSLPQNFSFASYLTCALHKTSIQMITIHPLTLLSVIFVSWIMGVDYTVLSSRDGGNHQAVPFVHMGFCVGLTGILVILYFVTLSFARQVEGEAVMHLARGEQAVDSTVEEGEAEIGNNREVHMKKKFSMSRVVLVFQAIIYNQAILSILAIYAVVMDNLEWYYFVLFSLPFIISIFIITPSTLYHHVVWHYCGQNVDLGIMTKFK